MICLIAFVIAFPPIITAFGGSDSNRGNTGPFWVGSGLAVFSAIVTFVFIKPLDQDGMAEEDRLVSIFSVRAPIAFSDSLPT